MSDFALVGLMPTYREGSLVDGAIRSLEDAGLDTIVVWEGPAGADRCDDAPETSNAILGHGHWKRGRWESDAAKRTEMLRHTLKQYPGRTVWGIWVDADELLVNGRHVRDLVQERVWYDEHGGASIADPDNLPTGGIPIRFVEYDGTCAFEQGRLLRLDTLRRFVVSNLIVETVLGSHVRLGRIPETTDLEEMAREAFPGRRIVSPPLPGEPVIVHRSHLRHPARQALRLHTQEAAELERLGLPR